MQNYIKRTQPAFCLQGGMITFAAAIIGVDGLGGGTTLGGGLITDVADPRDTDSTIFLPRVAIK